MDQLKPIAKPKRSDLQGIRGIAIISVLGFHFLPWIFPNGYVGVDQFFVLSGFLMCMLLRKSSKCSVSSIVFTFYTRRLKRILPLYLLIILLSILSVFSFFPATAIDTNLISGRKALMFMSNRAGTDNENYFSMLSLAIDVFTHTWSLSVEVQFYMIVPFLYLIGANNLLKTRFERAYYVVIGLLSFLYSIIFCTEIAAFNSVAARIWQFSVGMLAFLISDSRNSYDLENSNELYQETERKELLAEENDQETESTKTQDISYTHILLTVVLMFLSFFPLEIPARLLRPFVTIFTGLLMGSPSKCSNNLLESKFLTYCGDVSYSLYLIHWPIYAYWKLVYSRGDQWNYELFIAFALSLLLAIASYEFYEKWYLKQSGTEILIISLILLFLNIGVFYENDFRDRVSPFSRTTSRLDGLNETEIVSFEKAAELDKAWSAHDIAYLKLPTCDYEKENSQWGICRHKGLNNQSHTGKYKIMVVGNSWAANHGTLLYEECGHHANNLVQMSVVGCEPLYNNVTEHKECQNAVAGFEAKVKQEKPDYLFIISRFINIGDPMPPNTTTFEDDPIFKLMKIQIEKLTMFVKLKIYMMQQMPRLNIPMLADIVKMVKGHQNLTEFDKALITRDPEMARLRYEKITSECSKCELFDYKSTFFNQTTQTWRFYDERNHGLTYITQGLHLSFHGLELVRPIIRNICKKIR